MLAKISREAYKTRDITGGLPRVAELFEARRPKDPATISEIDGVVRFGDIKRGKREIFVTPMRRRRTVAIDETARGAAVRGGAGKHLRVHEGDRVRAGDRLSEGPVNPHDILRIKGPRAVQEYLLNEVQEVYRLQGVKINDKHIGVIVRQMLQKVRVLEPGDTRVPRGRARRQADLPRRRTSGRRRTKETPATSEPLLLGITKASLTTQSFISAARFQETTRVLTDACDSRREGRAAGPEGEHHHRSPDSGGYGHVPVPGSGHRGDRHSRGAGADCGAVAGSVVRGAAHGWGGELSGGGSLLPFGDDEE